MDLKGPWIEYSLGFLGDYNSLMPDYTYCGFVLDMPVSSSLSQFSFVQDSHNKAGAVSLTRPGESVVEAFMSDG